MKNITAPPTILCFILCATLNIVTSDVITYTFRPDSLSNMAARNACAEANMQLAYPKTTEEHDKLLDYLDTKPAAEVWFALYELEDDDDWRWYDGTAITYSMWDTANGEPSGRNQVEKCGRILVAERKWRDHPCGKDHPYVCQSIPAAPKLRLLRFDLLSNGKIPAASPIVPVVKVDSHIQCAVKCHNLDPCLRFTISDVTKMCGLYGSVDATNVADDGICFYGIP